MTKRKIMKMKRKASENCHHYHSPRPHYSRYYYRHPMYNRGNQEPGGERDEEVKDGRERCR